MAVGLNFIVVFKDGRSEMVNGGVSVAVVAVAVKICRSTDRSADT